LVGGEVFIALKLVSYYSLRCLQATISLNFWQRDFLFFFPFDFADFFIERGEIRIYQALEWVSVMFL